MTETPELTVDIARWLVGPEGLAAVTDATARLDGGDEELAIVSSLRADGHPREHTSAAVAAAHARRRARHRWKHADRLVFTRSSLEQASDPTVSAWRARRFRGWIVHDLCSGVGGDTVALSAESASVRAIDIDPARLVLLRHNLAVHSRSVVTEVANALDVRIPTDHVIHVDPSRREGGRRIVDPRVTAPPVDALLNAHQHVAGAGVVLAPGVDHDHPALPDDVEVEYLQRGDDLVEAVAWRGALRDGHAVASATLLPAAPPEHDAHADDPRQHVVHLARSAPRSTRLAVGSIGDHLVEVASAAVRARLHDELGAAIGARRLARRRALLTVDGAPPSSPWYRARPVLTVLPARARSVRSWLSTTDAGPVEIVLHGLELDPTRWWRELGRPPRGPDGVRVELIRRDDDAIAVVTLATSAR